MSPGSNHNFPSLDQWKLTAKKPALRLRAGIIQSIRRFFIERDYLEIETPCLIPAPAPETHIDAISAGSLFLQTSPELCMKRLLAAGYLFSSRRRHTIFKCDWSSDVCSSDLVAFTTNEQHATSTSTAIGSASTDDHHGG